MVALLVTLAMAFIGGAVTGLIINVEGIFDPLREHQFFNDEFFWALPTDAKSLGSKKGSMQVKSFEMKPSYVTKRGGLVGCRDYIVKVSKDF